MLELKEIVYNTKQFKLSVDSFHINSGEYLVVLGESGSGKTLLLDVIAGFRIPLSGKIFKNGEEITIHSIHKRKLAYVTAENSLFPHMTVKKNLLFASKSSKEEFSELCDWFQLWSLLKSYPKELSSGEKQRVALARAILSKPDVLLLDEPLSSVDVNARYEIILLLRQLHRKGNTILHVTHDIQEALLLAERVAIMQQGSIIQTGTLSEIIKTPANRFVAKLIGIKNVFHAEYYADGYYRINSSIKIFVNLKELFPTKALLIIQSNEIVLSKEKLESSMQNCFNGNILDVIIFENSADVVVDIGVTVHVTITVKSLIDLNIQVGYAVWISFKASAVRLVPLYSDE